MSHAQATLEGHVDLPKAHLAPVMNKRYEIVSKGDVISTNPALAIVYLEGTFPKPSTLPIQQMSQRGYAFDPGLLPVQVGTTVQFPNFDDTYHDVFSFSPARRFDLGRYRPDTKPVPSQTFDVPGPVTLRCDIHEHMRGLILVLDTPYFVITDVEGNFHLNNLPAGHYTLKAWLDSRTTLSQAVDIPKGGTVHARFP